ncbi:hypothetical protein ACRRTK_019049 [Alexandromys fortis]
MQCLCTSILCTCGRSCGCGRASMLACRPISWVHWKKNERRPLQPSQSQVQDQLEERAARAEDMVPIPIHYPPEFQQGLWGEEGQILGYRYANNNKLSSKVKKVWEPQLFTRELYRETLDKKFTVTVTMWNLDLINEAHGFYFYIPKTPKKDLCSKFGMDLKRGMLLRLACQDPQLHPDKLERRVAI